jgi:hypothetical protein
VDHGARDGVAEGPCVVTNTRAIETILWVIDKRTAATGPAGAAGNSAGTASCAIASASPVAGESPAKLGVA